MEECNEIEALKGFPHLYLKKNISIKLAKYSLYFKECFIWNEFHTKSIYTAGHFTEAIRVESLAQGHSRVEHPVYSPATGHLCN